MLRILGRRNSANTQKVLWLCGELDLPYELENFGRPFGGTDTPEYRALNPNGVVPTLIEDDFVLWESNACVHYLASKHAQGTWYPDDPRMRANAVRWMEWVTSTLVQAHLPVIRGVNRRAQGRHDPISISEARGVWAGKMAILDRYLEGRDYLTGNAITIADIPAAIFTFRWFTLDIPREDYSNLAAWYGRISAREAFRHNVMEIGLE